MIDFARIVGLDWDAGNSAKSTNKHGVLSSEAEQVFVNHPLFITPDEAHNQTERRFRALGKTMSGRLLTVVFMLRDHETKIRVISARGMNRQERDLYESET